MKKKLVVPDKMAVRMQSIFIGVLLLVAGLAIWLGLMGYSRDRVMSGLNYPFLFQYPVLVMAFTLSLIPLCLAWIITAFRARKTEYGMLRTLIAFVFLVTLAGLVFVLNTTLWRQYRHVDDLVVAGERYHLTERRTFSLVTYTLYRCDDDGVICGPMYYSDMNVACDPDSPCADPELQAPTDGQTIAIAHEGSVVFSYPRDGR